MSRVGPHPAPKMHYVVSLPRGPQGCCGYERRLASSLASARRIVEQYHGYREPCRLMRCADGSYEAMAPGTRYPLARHGWITWTSIRRVGLQAELAASVGPAPRCGRGGAS